MGSKLASSILLPAHIHATDLLLGKFIFLSLFQLGVQIVGPCKERVSRKNNEKVGVENKGTLFFPFHLFFLNCSLSLLRAALYHRNAWNRLNFVNIARTTKKKNRYKETLVGTANSAFLQHETAFNFRSHASLVSWPIHFHNMPCINVQPACDQASFFFFFGERGKEERVLLPSSPTKRKKDLLIAG